MAMVYRCAKTMVEKRESVLHFLRISAMLRRSLRQLLFIFRY
jgi:hypothetical protein